MTDQPRASHDSDTPENLLRFMVTGWATPPHSPAQPIEGIERFAARRAAVAAAFPGATIVVPTGHEKIRANDTTYRLTSAWAIPPITAHIPNSSVGYMNQPPSLNIAPAHCIYDPTRRSAMSG